LNKLYTAISKEENAHPEVALLVAGDFNAGKLVQPEGKKTLDHFYSTHRDAYKALPRHPFGKSDHNSTLLIPDYKQKLKQEAPASSDGIEEYTTSVTVFINKCIDDVVPTVTVRTYPNQKPWITGNIRTELKARTAAFKERTSNLEAYKKSRYALRRTIKQAKHQYRTKIESYYTGSDARRLWQGLQTITDYKGKRSRELPSEPTRRAKLLLCSLRGR
jgi:hypothetical protein